MSQVIKTIENVIADEVFDITDYPACNIFMPITETSGLVLDELVSGPVTFVPAVDETFTFAGGGVTTAGTFAMNTTLASLTTPLPNLGNTKDIVHLVVADFNADNANIKVGSGAAFAGLDLVRKAVTGTSAFRDETPTTDTLTSTAIDANTQVAAMYTNRSTPRLFLVESDGVAITSPQDIALTATAAMSINLNATPFLFSKDTKVYGIATFTFDALPGDVLAAVSWMNYQWRNGNKVIYPPWKNKT